MMSTDPETIVDAGTEDAPPEALTELEELAVEMGWKPEKDFEGPDGKWKPAKDWMKAERTINRGLKDTVKSLKDTVDRIARTSSKTTERALKVQAEEINARFSTAVQNKDVKGAAEAAKDMDELRIEAAPSVTPKDTEDQFARDNPWYGVDRKATAYAVMVAQELARKNIPLDKQLELIEADVRKEFPDLFDGVVPGARKAPPSVATPSRSTSQTRRERGFSDLPPEVKKAAEDYAKMFQTKHKADPEKTKAQYAKDYWSDAA